MPIILKDLGLILIIINVYYNLCDSSKLNIFQHKAAFFVSKMSLTISKLNKMGVLALRH